LGRLKKIKKAKMRIAGSISAILILIRVFEWRPEVGGLGK